MKLVAFADLHAHKFKDFDNKTDGTGSHRLDLIVETLKYIKNYCLCNDVKHILFAGDLFHVRGKVDTVVFNAIYDEIKTFNKDAIELIMIAGNHDQYDNSDVPEHSLHTFNDLEGVTVYSDLGIHSLYDGNEVVDIYCVPYSKNARRTKEWLSEQDQMTTSGNRYSNICLFHLGISGAFVGSGNYPMADAFNVEDLRPDYFKYIIGGHFHKRQQLGDYPHVFYCGAPIQHSFGDEGEDKGFYVVDTSKRWDVNFVPIPNPRFYTMTLHDIINEDMKAIADDGNYVRLTLKEDEVQTALSYLPHNLQYKIILEKVYEENTRVDVRIGMSEEEVVTKYAQEFNPDALEVGLKILSEVKGNVSSV